MTETTNHLFWNEGDYPSSQQNAILDEAQSKTVALANEFKEQKAYCRLMKDAVVSVTYTNDEITNQPKPTSISIHLFEEDIAPLSTQLTINQNFLSYLVGRLRQDSTGQIFINNKRISISENENGQILSNHNYYPPSFERSAEEIGEKLKQAGFECFSEEGSTHFIPSLSNLLRTVEAHR